MCKFYFFSVSNSGHIDWVHDSKLSSDVEWALSCSEDKTVPFVIQLCVQIHAHACTFVHIYAHSCISMHI